jgi:arginyl-tRNA synthetase
MKQVKTRLARSLSDKLGVEVSEQDIERPEPEHGDFAYPVMKAASELGENPRQLAEEVSKEMQDLEMVDSVDVASPGYLNFHLKRDKFAESVFQSFEKERFGLEPGDRKVLIEFSAPNLAKPMHIGHVRNNCLGDSLQRIFRFLDYDVTSENYIGDWGTKHGQVIYAFRKYGSQEAFEENPMEHMYHLYVKLHDEGDEEDRRRAREWSRKIEDGDEEALELWKMFREATIRHNEEEYERMGIEFDRVTGESVVAEDAQEIIQEGLEEGIFDEDEDGSVYVEFEDEQYPNTVVKRDDGSTLYISRDVANVRKREREGFDLSMYVVASEQNLHFQQVFEVARRFGYTDIENEHISYGMLQLPGETMSSSEGNIIRLSSMLDKAREKAAEIEGHEVDNAEEVGLGAIKYANLSVTRSKDITFEWSDVLDFEGDSGPYLQYTNVRAKSILQEAEKTLELAGELDEEEYRLVRKLSKFPEMVQAAADAREPAKIANYLSELCEDFNSFYHSCQVIGAGENTERRRLKVVKEFAKVSDQGLELLGIESLDEM